jgi:predicted phosphodiesterase
MKPTLILNDVHLGVARSAGTTPQSAAALKDDLLQGFANLLRIGPDKVIINGDLTDQFDIPLGEALDIYQVMDTWLAETDEHELVVALGNHDLSKDSAKLGTVQFIGALLGMKYPDNFTLIDKPTDIGDGIYVVPHLVNQAHFDLALEAVPEGTKYLLVHVNYDNNFATQSDHSLNMSRAQAKELTDRGITVVFGHEHQGRTAFGGKVVIVGNQLSSSISDCMAHGDGQTDGKKFALILDGDGYWKVQTWSRSGPDGLDEIDWRDLKDRQDSRAFVRVIGEAEADEAADVIKAISNFRQRIGASTFVVTNAVKVAQLIDTDELDVSAEDVRSVNVVEMLLESLTEEQAAVVRALMEQEQ